MGQICTGRDRLEKYLREVFCNLGGLADEVARQQRALAGDREAREAEFCRREELFRRQRDELEATLARIQDLAGQLSAPVAADSATGPLQQILSGAEQERSALLAALQETGSQSSRLGQMAEEVAAARRDLAEAREEIRAQRDLLERAGSEPCGSEEMEIRQRLAESDQERNAWSQERAVLETELDCVRNRAAELADALEEERRKAAEDRKDWAEELRRMRRLLETLAERPAMPRAGASPVQAVLPASPSLAAARVAVEEDAGSDPVLDSVMAQFEILQKDLARRRKARPAVQLGS